MADKIKGRLQTPIDETTGERKDIHLITTSDEVLVSDTNNETKTLTDVLKNLHTNIVISSVDSKPTYPTLWFRTDDA